MPILVLIRHGQSAWNLENRFTGWWDVDITEKGAEEARLAGELMAAKGLDFDLCFTSLQTRAIKTLNLALEEMGRLWLPVEKDWRLNERHYGGVNRVHQARTPAQTGGGRGALWRADRPQQGRDRRKARRRAGPYLAPQLRYPAAAAGTGQPVRPVAGPA